MLTFTIDQREIEFKKGDSILQAASRAGIYIPHLCYHPEFSLHGSCRVCTVKVNGLYRASCTLPAAEGLNVLNLDEEVNQHRQLLLEMLFVEGNHVCPSCEKSGSCTLQSVAEFCGMLSPSLPFQYPNRQVDASHDVFILDFNRCINCELCVRASRDVDGKSIFSMTGRGADTHLVVNSEDGLLASSGFDKTDRAASICPVGVILPKHQGFQLPIGERVFDKIAINKQRMEVKD